MRAGLLAFAWAAASIGVAVAQPAEPPPNLDSPALSSAALARGVRADRLIGTEVYARDDDLGEVDDVIVDVQGAKVLAIIVSINGLFTNKLVAIPPQSLKVGAEDRLTVDLPISAFKAAPEFEYSERKFRE